MDYKQAIEVIKSNYPPKHYTMLAEALDLAIDVLEKQIPKAPIETQELADVEWLCPVCKHTVGDCVTIDNYCKNCGQKIGWAEL